MSCVDKDWLFARFTCSTESLADTDLTKGFADTCGTIELLFIDSVEGERKFGVRGRGETFYGGVRRENMTWIGLGSKLGLISS